jgi:hypothetical protein
MSDVAYGTKKRPVVLDFAQILRKVEWILGPNIAMIHFDVNCQLHTPHAVPLSAIGVSLADVFTSTAINIHDDFLTVPTPTNPVTPEMAAHTLAWNRAPRKPSAGSDLQYRWKAVLFLNLGRIKSFRDIQDPTFDVVVNFPASEKKTESGFIHYAYFNFGTLSFAIAKAFPLYAVPVFFTEEQRDNNTPVITGNIQLFGSVAERDHFITLQPDPWGAQEEPATGDTFDLLDWEVKAYTYKKRKDFPLNNDLNPTYAVDEKQIAFQVQHDHATLAVQIPARTVTFTINLKTLTMTSKKV